MVIQIYAQNPVGGGYSWANKTLVWDSSAVGQYGDLECGIYDGKLTVDIEKVPSLSFTIPDTHQFYSSFQKLLTVLTVVTDDGDTLFRGAIKEIEVDIFRQKKITANGDMEYLEHSIYIPGGKDVKETPYSRFSKAITAHNYMMTGSLPSPYSVKQFTVGTVSIKGSSLNQESDIKTYNDNTHQDVYSMIKNDLIDVHGGYLKLRYNADYTTCYVDWIDKYSDETSTQDIEFGVNVVELTRQENDDDLFTALVPSGNENLHLDTGISGTHTVTIKDQTGADQTITVIRDGRCLMIPDGMQKFGLIYKTESFSVTTKEKLLSEALDYISNNYRPEQLTYTINVIDMHWLDDSTRRIKLGDLCTIHESVAPGGSGGSSGTQLTCTAISYDLMEPENTEFTLGVPYQSLSRKQSASSSSSSKSSSNNSSAVSNCAVVVNGKVSTLRNDTVKIIGNDHVYIEGDEIKIKQNSFLIEDKLGNKIVSIDDDVTTLKDLVVGTLTADQAGIIHGHVGELTVDTDTTTGDLYVANEVLIGTGNAQFERFIVQSNGVSMLRIGVGEYADTAFVYTTAGTGSGPGATTMPGFMVGNNVFVVGPYEVKINQPITANLTVRNAELAINTGGTFEHTASSGGYKTGISSTGIFTVNNGTNDILQVQPSQNKIRIYGLSSSGTYLGSKDIYNHKHKITISSNDPDDGVHTVSIGDMVFTSDNSDTTATFDIAATDFFISSVAAAKEEGAAEAKADVVKNWWVWEDDPPQSNRIKATFSPSKGTGSSVIVHLEMDSGSWNTTTYERTIALKDTGVSPVATIAYVNISGQTIYDLGEAAGAASGYDTGYIAGWAAYYDNASLQSGCYWDPDYVNGNNSEFWRPQRTVSRDSNNNWISGYDSSAFLITSITLNQSGGTVNASTNTGATGSLSITGYHPTGPYRMKCTDVVTDQAGTTDEEKTYTFEITIGYSAAQSLGSFTKNSSYNFYR